MDMVCLVVVVIFLYKIKTDIRKWIFRFHYCGINEVVQYKNKIKAWLVIKWDKQFSIGQNSL
jgi:hypothetical protein